MKYAKKMQCVMVMKDAVTVISGCNDSENVYLNRSGNAGMATAGSGDALTGMIAGMACMFLAENREEPKEHIAALGVYIHGLSGDMAAVTYGENSMTAADLIESIHCVFRQ